MEIGSAYALQVCLLQIPAMVAFSAWYAPDKMGEVANTFTFVFVFLSYGHLTDVDWRVQTYFPPMGCRRHHTVDVLDDVHLHRSEE